MRFLLLSAITEKTKTHPNEKRVDAPLAEGLLTTVRLAYGEEVCEAGGSVFDDIGAFCQARDRAVSAKNSTAKEAQAAAVTYATYLAILTALERPLGDALGDIDEKFLPKLPFGWRSALEKDAEAKMSLLHLERGASVDPLDQCESRRLSAAPTPSGAALWNLAMANASSGALLPRDSEEEVKKATRHFQVAAGALDELATLGLVVKIAGRDLRQNPGSMGGCEQRLFTPLAVNRQNPGSMGGWSKPKPPPELEETACRCAQRLFTPLAVNRPPPELEETTAKPLSALMVAFAQECLCRMAELSGKAAGTRAILGMGAVDAFAAAATALSSHGVDKAVKGWALVARQARQL